jgi:demethylmenaquinone methyltransferase/2-methoxy-6-polyprenyl-1,4-benzoquinol methylase
VNDLVHLVRRDRSAARVDLPRGEEKVRAVRAMFDTIAPRYDLLNRLLTFGLDRRWRRQAVQALALTPGSRVLDLACGTGDLCRDLDAAGFSATGMDLSFGMLAHARTASPLVQADVLRLPVADGSADGAICGFALRNLVELDGFFVALARALRPGGRLSLLEVGQPDNRLLGWGHGLYFGHVVPVIGGVLSDRAAYRYLPRSVAYLPPVPDLLDRLRAAGFATVERRVLSGGIAQLITATRSSPGPSVVPLTTHRPVTIEDPATAG